jgi:voltage-gated potassium channel
MHFIGYKSKFFYLLCSLILYFVGASFLSGINYTTALLSLFFSIIILFCVYIVSRSKKLIITTLALGLVSLTNHWIMYFFNLKPAYFAFSCLINIIFLGIITTVVLRLIMEHKRITSDTLFGAISAYFLIGFIWTYLYILIDVINPSAFSAHTISSSIHEKTQHFLYFSFTTLTTLGYGDILPLSNVARTFSWLEAVAGQTYLAVWISQLVGLRISQKV